MRLFRRLGVACAASQLLFGGLALSTAAAEPMTIALSKEQAADRSNFIALVKKARQGDAESQWQIGVIYTKLGELTRALPVLRNAAEAGHAQAASLLGWFHENGSGVQKDLEEARRWYRLGAERQDASAIGALGRLLLREEGAESRKNARHLLEKAAALGDADGQYYLGWMLIEKQGTDAGAAEAQAYDWFSKAANQAHVGAQIAMATQLLQGRGVPQDKELAIKWLRRATQSNDPVAHYLLGRADEGEVHEIENIERAKTAFRVAAVAGHREAQYALGNLLAKSSAASEKAEAVGWLTKAREAGHIGAANRLGEMYRDGVGVLPQPDTARRIFEQAAEQGNVNAMYNLAGMQNDGLGGIRDTGRALDWYAKAADRGHQGAADVLGGLLNSQTKMSSLGLKGFWHQQ